MMKITMIEVQKNNKDRFNLYIDGEFKMGIDSATYIQFNLRKGDQLTKEQLQAIEHYDSYRRAINSALVYLSYKKRTESEIRDYLKKGEVPDETINRVIQYCRDNRYIDHRDYCLSLMNTMILTTDKGPDVYRQKLFEKGIEKVLIDEFYDRYTEQMDEERMVKLINKQMEKQLKKSSRKMAEQKTMHTLAQKGYNLNIVLPYMKDMSYDKNDEVLQKELEKQVNKLSRKYNGIELKQRVTAAMMRKGFEFDGIQTALKESGMEDE